MNPESPSYRLTSHYPHRLNEEDRDPNSINAVWDSNRSIFRGLFLLTEKVYGNPDFWWAEHGPNRADPYSRQKLETAEDYTIRTLAIITTLVTRLPDKQRKMITLSYDLDLSHQSGDYSDRPNGTPYSPEKVRKMKNCCPDADGEQADCTTWKVTYHRREGIAQLREWIDSGDPTHYDPLTSLVIKER